MLYSLSTCVTDIDVVNRNQFCIETTTISSKMAGGEQASHRPGLLKQQNKSHKTGRHRSKSEIDKNNKGRVHVKLISKRKNQELKRDERRKKANQLRSKKREDILAKKRAIGGSDSAPFLSAIIPIGESANLQKLLKQMKECDADAKVEITGCNIMHINIPRFRQNFSLIIPQPGDLYAALDACKVVDSVIFLVSPPSDSDSCVSHSTNNEGVLGFDSSGEELLSAIMAQGLPSPIFVVNDIDVISAKKRNDYKKLLLKQLDQMVPVEKLQVIENESDALRLFHQIGSQKQRPVYQRNMRCHFLCEEVNFKQSLDDPTVGTLIVDGYVRYQPLNVNGLVHIPGWGDFQMERIEVQRNPGEFIFLEEANPSLQETLKSENDPDPMNGEQTWPYQEEMDGQTLEDGKIEDNEEMEIKKRFPKGTSEYQAAWIKDDDNDANQEDEKEEDDSDDWEDDCEDMIEDDDNESGTSSEEDEEDEMESVEMEGGDTHVYDKKVNFADEENDLKRIKEAREDELFPDEVDTPRDTLAKVRFQKYRGLKSFRTSPWDPKENLPMDYSRTFQFQNFQRTRKRVLKEERTGAKPGWYVRVHVKNVPSHLPAGLQPGYPLALVGMLPHEQKMSVINLVLKRFKNTRDQQAIPSKERLIFHCGYRRYAASPIFSQHTAANKHKYERFFRPESVVVATLYAPIMFPPASVLVFREKKDGSQIMTATGSVLSVNPDRITVKRAVLSGAPFKVHRKSAVLRFMFFNREDIEWFKPVELRTKYGRRGHIREPLGTHGHMKCVFDGQIKSQDTIMMNLYKRVFPKWSYDPNVAFPPALYNHEAEMEDAANQLMS